MIEMYEIPEPVVENVGRFQEPTETCQHTFVLTRHVCINGSTQYKTQCMKCGKGSGAIAHGSLTPEDRATALAYDEKLKDRIYAIAYGEWKATRSKSQNPTWKAWYHTYLLSGLWQRRRKAVMRRARGWCEHCGMEPPTEAHHLNYDFVGREAMRDLLAVCRSCHEQLYQGSIF